MRGELLVNIIKLLWQECVMFAFLWKVWWNKKARHNLDINIMIAGDLEVKTNIEEESKY